MGRGRWNLLIGLARTLTPALSHQREKRLNGSFSPVPGGEGWGEGVCAARVERHC
jgi:hypothetical protein